jgi:hypothetical protein
MTGTKGKQPNPKKQNTNNEPQHKKTKWANEPQHKKTKCATFIYSGKETKQITKLFKDTHQNSLQNTEHDTKTDKTTHIIREIQQRHLPTKMPRLPTKIHWPNRQSIPHQIQRTHISNNSNSAGA